MQLGTLVALLAMLINSAFGNEYTIYLSNFVFNMNNYQWKVADTGMDVILFKFTLA